MGTGNPECGHRARVNLRPLWEQRAASRSGWAAAPAIWRFDEVRAALLRAAEPVMAGDAQRRVLVLENPGLPDATSIGPTLFAGMQVILPGEVAPVHRHTPSALRFIIEGEGAYTTLDGERVAMSPGDFVVTPAWAWHAHGNTGSEPVIWLDGLDSPLARIFGAFFREDQCSETRAAHRPRRTLYPYAEMLEELERLGRRGAPHPAHGYLARYIDPSSGGDPIPTLAAFLRSLPAGFAGETYRSTESAVFNVVAGRGSVTIAGAQYGFRPHDVFFVPSCAPYCLRAKQDCVLFSYSDRAAQEALEFWRELP
jgi:gentisate 1,2-dioxygenase